ncbi:efflux RND transporter permease subunit [Falsirhodobacter sp. alg1]|uniref:efflux RND transporter permease subunit n=1 Tax=Falsirhodobacter sp. alg1 TaxID=1472418 RepID=UPI000787EA77|nr:efflux RND transporter permease subunit [Falsirhodobacter sp. alg1]
MFNTGVDRLTGGYINVVRRLITRPIRILIVVAVVAGACWWTYDNLRTGFLPTEDQGVLMTMVTLPQRR